VRRIVMFTSIAVALSACGNVLSGVGDLSSEIVHPDDSPTTTTEPTSGGQALNLKGIIDITWINDELGPSRDLPPDDTVIAVWFRGDQVTPWIQASRREIANALPAAGLGPRTGQPASGPPTSSCRFGRAGISKC